MKTFEEWFEYFQKSDIRDGEYSIGEEAWNAALEEAASHLSSNGTPAEDRYGREPDKVKPLAQYLDEYIEHEAKLRNVEPPAAYMYAYNSWRELLEQALDAYESTQGVQIRIERILGV